MRTAFPLISVLLASCGGGDAVEEGPPNLELLEKRAQLIRLSVDLRGIHPTEADIRAYEAAPELWNHFVDDWIEDDRFIDRLKEIFNLRYFSRNGETYFDLEEAEVFGVDDDLMADYIADEPLQLLQYIIKNDLPYSYIVTAEHTMANPALAAMWDISYPISGSGWQVADYRDGRPQAGMLTMTTLWQRYPSMGGNANRHRANAISKMFLCDDYLSRPIVLNRAAVDQLTVDPETAINQNDGCQACHSTLDPLAANFFGFFTYDDDIGIEQTVYRPEFEEEWRAYSGKPPGYYGRPTANIREFSGMLAADSRFADCAVTTVFEGLTQRTIVEDDWTELSQHIDAFQASDQNLKELVRSIVLAPEYVALSSDNTTYNDRLAGVKTASPAQLASIVEDVTGYRWSFDGRDGLTTGDIGLPVLMGGIDSQFVTVPSYIPSVGAAFTIERLSQAASWYVAEADLSPDREGDARLLVYVTIEDTPDNNSEAFQTQIRHLYTAITGTPLPDDASEPEELMALWKYLYSVEASAPQAWSGVISAVLRDPRVIFY